MTTMLKTTFTKIMLPVMAILFFASCQKEVSGDGSNTVVLPDFETKVASSVSGFVTDENDAPVLGASVTAGTGSAITDKYGFFEIKNTQVVKNAAVVTVNKAGYFNGIKTYLAEAGKSAFFRIKMIPKTLAGTVPAATGGNVTLTNGLSISFPANAVVNASSNTPYSGNINVAAHWISPTATDLNLEMPGDLRGISTDGSLKTLTTYGMVAVELTGTSGELLQIASGQKATLTMPIPSAILSNAPATIPLWSFDETKGLWKEEGQAVKSGSNYVGDVSHFSFWNCDVPANYVQFNCTVKNSDGIPISQALVKISVVGNPNNAGYGYTDSSGYVGGAIPANAQLLLEIFPGYNCNTPIYSQNFSSGTTNISLGVITVNISLGLATVSGTVTNCTGNPVTNGFIISQINNYYYRYALSNTGSFSFTSVLCNNTANAVFIAEDLTSLQQSAPLNQTLVPGANAIGNLQACGTSIQQFISYTIDGGAPIEFTYPTDSLGHYGNGSTAINTIYGSRNAPTPQTFVNFSFTNAGIGLGSVQTLETFGSSELGTQTSQPSSINVNITEYGAVGEFIAGNFTGIVVAPGTPPVNKTVSCTFRVRRSF